VGGNLRGVRDYPIDLGKHQKQLVYSPHDYGPSYINNLGSMKALTKKLCIMIAGEITGHTYTRKTSLL